MAPPTLVVNGILVLAFFICTSFQNEVYNYIYIYIYIYIFYKFIQKQLKMAITVAGWAVGVTDFYGMKLGEEFKTYKTAQFFVWDIHFLEWR